ncbi:hypothetical protein JD844_011210 [Phrynosoma platyrhinos]|uniref:Hedgehog N-terminal signalling domain-containing protein n=1 Tax=Phrynosoma platyrhinos TaxID=52577 RepID=A0ABQ7TIV6_PHRPL|nr:hypothetical protein JD844_011210 [Phrynosoma platyrhinos]
MAWLLVPVLVLALALVLAPASEGCGPGRGPAGRKASPRRSALSPLRYRESVPVVAEQSLGASGKAEGKVGRLSERFSQLAPNYNPDIVLLAQRHEGAIKPLVQSKAQYLKQSIQFQWER